MKNAIKTNRTAPKLTEAMRADLLIVDDGLGLTCLDWNTVLALRALGLVYDDGDANGDPPRLTDAGRAALRGES